MMHLPRLTRRQLLLTSLGVGVATLLPSRLLSGSSDRAFAASATDAFDRTWSRTDQPVATSQVSRTWMWGPSALTQISEDGRLVRYYDKARMEDNTVNAQPPWDVTTGLLTKEMITGQFQSGASSYIDRGASQVNVAGDANDPNGPTYATFNPLMGYGAIPSGWKITQTVDRAGTVGNDSSLESYNVTAQDVGAPTNHTVASVFWDFMNSTGLVYQDGEYVVDQLFTNPFYATGYPLTEPYWTNVLVGGVQKQVLVQVFERRVLTYTPSNPDGWKVESGNVGRHYYESKYGKVPDSKGGGNPPSGEQLFPKETGSLDQGVEIINADADRGVIVNSNVGSMQDVYDIRQKIAPNDRFQFNFYDDPNEVPDDPRGASTWYDPNLTNFQVDFGVTGKRTMYTDSNGVFQFNFYLPEISPEKRDAFNGQVTGYIIGTINRKDSLDNPYGPAFADIFNKYIVVPHAAGDKNYLFNVKYSS